MGHAGFHPQGTHLGLLADLMVADGQRQQDLAMSGIKDKGTVARSLAQLEEAGFIRRRTAATDRRAKLIFLTPAGRAFWENATAVVSEIMPGVVADIPPQKLAVCLEVLTTLYERLHAEAFLTESSTHG